LFLAQYSLIIQSPLHYLITVSTSICLDHFYNKPWGVRHWIAHAEPKVSDLTVVALIDPDMIFLRPITTKIKGQPSNLVSKGIKDEDLVDRISLGHPVAQMYGLGAPWTNDTHLKFNRTKICGVGSPCLETKMKFGEDHYAVGPPYIMVKADMRRLSQSWTDFVFRVFEGYPHLLAEMYAYSMAAAHEKLPHLQLQNFMVSNTDSYGEGWIFIDQLEEVCVPPVNGVYQPEKLLPTLLHYCQNFRAGDVGFAKRQVRPLTQQIGNSKTISLTLLLITHL
jgi:peptidyl serine alpha-galactosyltransferase